MVRAIRMLELHRHYQPNANHDSEVVREQWRTRTITPLIDALAKGVHCGGCITLQPFHSSIEWFPNDPYLTPNQVGDGYIFPSWYIADDIAAFVYDAEIHAAITSVERIPSGSWPLIVPASGWPRFRINFSGTGVVELHFSSIHYGSLVQVQVDNDLLGMEWIDVHQHALAIPPETANVVIYEREITTPGVHHIDCTIIPTLGTLPIPINFGGGLVKVELCGFTPQFPGTGADLMGLQMRLDALCGMEFSTDGGGEWTPVTGWDANAAACFLGDPGAAGIDGADGLDGLDGADGADGIDGIDGEDGQTTNEFPVDPDPGSDEMCGSAWYIAEQLDAMIQQAIIDTTTSTLEQWLIVLLAVGGFNADFLLALWEHLFGNPSPTLAADVLAAIPAVAKAFYCAGLDVTAAQTAIVADLSIPSEAAEAYRSGIDTLDAVKFDLWTFVGAQDTGRDCVGMCDEGDWINFLDFTIEAYEFTPVTPGTTGIYVPASYWMDGTVNPPSGSANLTGSLIFATPTNIKGIDTDYEIVTSPASYIAAVILYRSVGSPLQYNVVNSVGRRTHHLVLDVPNVTSILWAFQDTDPADEFRIHSIQVEGTDNNPHFGVDL